MRPRIIIKASVIDGTEERKVYAIVADDVAGELVTEGWGDGDDPSIRELEVYPEYRGRGIARLLLDAIIREAVNTREINQLRVTVGRANAAANRVYAAVGFVTDSRPVPSYLKLTANHEEWVDLVLDVRSLRRKARTAKRRCAVA